MAVLLNKKNNQRVVLRSQHLFGRHGGSCNTVLLDKEASRMHASISYNGVHWLLQDNSRNGSFINGKHFVQGCKQPLKVGDVISFGHVLATQWQVIDDEPPKSLLVPIVSGNTVQAADDEVIELDNFKVLPDEDHPEVVLYTTVQGNWLCEEPRGVRSLVSGDQVITSSGSWYFVDAEIMEMTKPLTDDSLQALGHIKLTFDVSQDEEHVELTIAYHDTTLALGDRSHHYLLLIIARKYLADSQLAIHERDKGWVDKAVLSHDLGITESHINIQIFRFRKNLVDLSPDMPLLQQIIERRKGELRFVGCQIEINGGNSNPE